MIPVPTQTVTGGLRRISVAEGFNCSVGSQKKLRSLRPLVALKRSASPRPAPADHWGSSDSQCSRRAFLCLTRRRTINWLSGQ
jgi:hypothetical protein